MAKETLALSPRGARTNEAEPTELVTAEEFAARAEEFGPAELVAGRIVKKPMNNHIHAQIVGELGRQLGNFARPLGRVLSGEVGIYIRRNPDTARAADVVFISNERYARMQSRVYLDVAPELVVEIIAPDNRWTEIFEKIYEYFAIGVDVVWMIDPALREVRVFTSPGEAQLLRAEQEDVLKGAGVLEGLNIPLRELFAAAPLA